MVAFAEHATVAQRTVQPAPQQAAAHRRHGGIQHAEQGVPRIAIDAGIEFQVPARGGVERDAIVGRFEGDRGEVGQALLLRLLDVGQQRAGGAGRQRPAFEAEGAQVVQAEEAQQLAPAGVGLETPGRAPAQAGQGSQLPCRV